MEEKLIIKKIEKCILKTIDLECIKINRETTANDVDGWDSLSHMGIIVEVENEFNINFQFSEIANLKNIGDFVDLINSKI